MSEKNKPSNQQGKASAQSSNTKSSSTSSAKSPDQQQGKGADKSSHQSSNHRQGNHQQSNQQHGKVSTSAASSNTAPSTPADQSNKSAATQTSQTTNSKASPKSSQTSGQTSGHSSGDKSGQKDAKSSEQKPTSQAKPSPTSNDTHTAKSSPNATKSSENNPLTNTSTTKATSQHSASTHTANASKNANSTPTDKGQNKDQNKGDSKGDTKANPKPAANAKPTDTKSTSPDGANKPPVSTLKKSDNGKPKGGNGLTYLALAIALAGLGLGIYNVINQDENASAEISAVQQRLTSLENAQNDDQSEQSIDALNEQVAQLQKQVSANKPQPALSEQEVSALIEQQLSAQPQAISAEQIKEYIDAELASTNNKDAGLTEQQVQTQIKQALASFAQDTSETPSFDFSAEIAQVQQSQQQAQQAVKEVEQKATDIQRTLAEQAQSIQTQISQVDEQPNPHPVLHLLQLANTAAQTGNAGPAALYLEQALDEFTTFNLDQAPFAAFKADIEQQATQLRDIAKSNNPGKTIDSIINSIDQWPFKQANASAESTQSTEEADSGFMAGVKNIGKNILDNTVSVTRNDADGLVWINENAQLQHLIRQNVRLDLAYARNALLYQDSETYDATAARLQENITRYFDETNASVRQALDTLSSIDAQQLQFPNLSDLIEQFSQAASKE